ncbi:MAG: glycosyltransferase [Candidatus Omnitrophota bacterium]|nr:glycosyltransferase [Candidatus Omnitrophota bacterium]
MFQSDKKDRPLKIAIIHAADKGGGAESSVLSLHKGLMELGHESRLYVGYKYTNTRNVIAIPRVRTIPGLLRLTHFLEQNFGWQYLYSPGFRALRKTIETDTDIMHFNSLWGGGGFADIGALPLLTKKYPAVITLREQWLMTGHCACPFDCLRWLKGCGKCPDLTLAPSINRDGTRFNWSRKRTVLCRTNAHIAVISNWLKAEAERSPILKGKKVSVVFNGIDDKVFKPGSKENARDSLGIPHDKFIVLLAGQTIEGINQGIAQQAVEALNQCDEQNLMALLIGKSAHRVARGVTILNKVLPFQEKPEEMASCYRAADITVVTSEFESFGRIAAESQACGTPVVAFSTGGLKEVVKDGVCGILVTAGDVKRLKDAIQILVKDTAKVKQMGESGTVWAREQFSNTKITEDYVKLYRQVIEERAGS